MMSPLISANVSTNLHVSHDIQLSGEITITHPDDITFENGTFGKIIVWNATTDVPKNYTVTRNDTIIESSASWDGRIIDIPVDWIYRDDLVTAVPILFIYECIVFDMENDSISDVVEVLVQPDTTPPQIESPLDFEYEVGSIGNYIRWNITETNPDFFNITRRSNETSGNESIIDSGNWGGQNFTINVDMLNESRWYEYTIWLNDTLGHEASASVNITVSPDLSAPVIDSPDDISFEFGSSSHFLTWHTYDSNPKNYSLEVIVISNDPNYGNSSEFTGPPSNTTESWTITNPDGLNIEFALDRLYVGNYTYSLTLFDINDLNVTDSVNITIYHDIRAPIIESPGNVDYEEGYTGFNLEWSAEESNPLSYNLTLDGEIIQEGRWRGENITLNVDGYLPGLYELNLTLVDYFEQLSSDIVFVDVSPDSQMPLIDSVTVIESFATVSENTLAVQAYIADLNGINHAEVEWYTSLNESINEESMTSVSNNLFSATLGDFVLGTVLYYRVTAVDNSTAQNASTTDWIEFNISTMSPEPTPSIVWGLLLVLGALSLIVILSLYFRTRTR